MFNGDEIGMSFDSLRIYTALCMHLSVIPIERLALLFDSLLLQTSNLHRVTVYAYCCGNTVYTVDRISTAVNTNDGLLRGLPF